MLWLVGMFRFDRCWCIIVLCCTQLLALLRQTEWLVLKLCTKINLFQKEFFVWWWFAFIRIRGVCTSCVISTLIELNLNERNCELCGNYECATRRDSTMFNMQISHNINRILSLIYCPMIYCNYSLINMGAGTLSKIKRIQVISTLSKR